MLYHSSTPHVLYLSLCARINIFISMKGEQMRYFYHYFYQHGTKKINIRKRNSETNSDIYCACSQEPTAVQNDIITSLSVSGMTEFTNYKMYRAC